MANCINCGTSIGFLNRPLNGLGKTKEGGEVCFKCYTAIIKKKPGMPGIVLTMTNQDVKDFFQGASQAKADGKIKLDEIKRQISALGVDGVQAFFGRKEIDELPNILREGETIKDIVQGIYKGNNGILVATETRLVFIDKKLMGGITTEEFLYKHISSISESTGIIAGKITVTVSGTKADIDSVLKSRVRPFVEKARVAIGNIHNTPTVAPTTIINQAVDVADQLAKLADLKAKGILTEEEFAQQKSKLLNL